MYFEPPFTIVTLPEIAYIETAVGICTFEPADDMLFIPTVELVTITADIKKVQKYLFKVCMISCDEFREMLLDE